MDNVTKFFLLCAYPDLAFDDHWITVKPNGPDAKGAHMLIGEGGEVKAGAGGKFNGKKISEIPRTFSKQSTPSRSFTPEQDDNTIKSAAKSLVSSNGRRPPSPTRTPGTGEWVSQERYESQVGELKKLHGDMIEKKKTLASIEGSGNKDAISAAKANLADAIRAEKKYYVQEGLGVNAVLDVPFSEKDEVKKMGATWLPDEKRWAVPKGVDASKFKKWVDENY